MSATNNQNINGNEQTHYQLLKINPSADQQVIKEAYRTAALSFHPDKYQNYKNEDHQFHLIQVAYECLRDPISRKEYDQQLLLKQSKQISKRSSAVVVSVDSVLDAPPHVWYVCRCGQEMDLAEMSSDDHDDTVVECKSCSLLYDTVQLWHLDEDDEVEGK